VDEEQVGEEVEQRTKWMMLSPWWLAKFHYETARRHHGFPPPLNGLGQMLLDTYNLAIPPKILKQWIEEFKYNS
jgi:hypothetical protein